MSVAVLLLVVLVLTRAHSARYIPLCNSVRVVEPGLQLELWTGLSLLFQPP